MTTFEGGFLLILAFIFGVPLLLLLAQFVGCADWNEGQTHLGCAGVGDCFAAGFFPLPGQWRNSEAS